MKFIGTLIDSSCLDSSWVSGDSNEPIFIPDIKMLSDEGGLV